MIIGVVGSRRRNTNEDFSKVRTAVMAFWKFGDVMVSGGCQEGADHFAELIRDAYDIPLKIHYPDKSELDPKLPPKVAYAKICYAHNELIARDADILIACVAPDRKGGTENTIQHFRRFNRKKKLDPDDGLVLV